MNDKDKILTLTNGGLDIFVHYLGEDCRKKLFRNPYRQDNNPSCHLYYHQADGSSAGRYLLKDFGHSEWCGDCFWFVSKVENISLQADFSAVLHLIDRELNLYVLDADDSVMIKRLTAKKVVPAPRIQETRPYKFMPKYRHFNRYELEYWASYGIGREILERYNVKCLSTCKLEREDHTGFTIYSAMDNPAYGYVFGQDEGIKIYRPKNDCRFLYAGHLPKPYIFGWEQLPPLGDRVYITGGEKDVLSLAAAGFNAIALNSETAKLPMNIQEELLQRYGHIVFVYDTDSTGLTESRLRVQESQRPDRVHRIVLPLEGTKKEKDASDFFRKGNSAQDIVWLTNAEINKTKNQ